MSPSEFQEYCRKADAMRKLGVQVGDVLTCDEGAVARKHPQTGRLCVRISEYCVLDSTGPRFFVHGFHRGLVANVQCGRIPEGAKLRVVAKREKSVDLELEEEDDG